MAPRAFGFPLEDRFPMHLRGTGTYGRALVAMNEVVFVVATTRSTEPIDTHLNSTYTQVTLTWSPAGIPNQSLRTVVSGVVATAPLPVAWACANEQISNRQCRGKLRLAVDQTKTCSVPPATWRWSVQSHFAGKIRFGCNPNQSSCFLQGPHRARNKQGTRNLRYR